jgi:hypothetical protein
LLFQLHKVSLKQLILSKQTLMNKINAKIYTSVRISSYLIKFLVILGGQTA